MEEGVSLIEEPNVTLYLLIRWCQSQRCTHCGGVCGGHERGGDGVNPSVTDLGRVHQKHPVVAEALLVTFRFRVRRLVGLFKGQ